MRISRTSSDGAVPLFYFVPIRSLRSLRVLAKTWTKNCRSLAFFSRAEGPLERSAARSAAQRSFTVQLLSATAPHHPLPNRFVSLADSRVVPPRSPIRWRLTAFAPPVARVAHPSHESHGSRRLRVLPRATATARFLSSDCQNSTNKSSLSVALTHRRVRRAPAATRRRWLGASIERIQQR